MSQVEMPDGTLVGQGGPEDRATWLTCTYCKFTGPLVGTEPSSGEHRCIASCGVNVQQNLNVPLALGSRKKQGLPPYDKKEDDNDG